jgi:hypothetical protein
MLHFTNDVHARPDSRPLKIFVGVCDLGRCLYESECEMPWELMPPTPKHDVEKEIAKYPHIAPEMLAPKP